MKFARTVDIWNIPQPLVKYLQRGQWVRAGQNGDLGRFWGVKPKSGVIVVAWQGNARNSGDHRSYNRSLHQYAIAQ